MMFFLRDIPRSNFEKNNVVEFRIPNGTLNEVIWQNYINFFTKFLLACKKEVDPKELIYKIKNNMHSSIELANYVFDSQVDKNNFLIQTMKTNDIYAKKLVKHIRYDKDLFDI